MRDGERVFKHAITIEYVSKDPRMRRYRLPVKISQELADAIRVSFSEIGIDKVLFFHTEIRVMVKDSTEWEKQELVIAAICSALGYKREEVEINKKATRGQIRP